MKRKIASLLMMSSFVVLCVTGLLSYFSEYTRLIATVHTVFGFVFTLIATVHIFNNIKPLKGYMRSWQVFPLLALIITLAYASISEVSVIKKIMDYGARSKAKIGMVSESNTYAEIEMALDMDGQLNFELKRGAHFWHPQIAVWTEDTIGNYLETLYITKATAKGVFAGGRTKDNFKALDSEEIAIEDGYRRVNALPVWSHQRGVIYEDGMYVPTYENPLPDAISGATPLDNFLLKTTVDYTGMFVVKLEINVAFDDNEYYSEFDFPEDDTFHNGTGQLGQPSIVFKGQIDPRNNNNYQLMKLVGRGHHSAKDGTIHTDMTKLTTALEIVEFVVVGYTK